MAMHKLKTRHVTPMGDGIMDAAANAARAESDEEAGFQAFNRAYGEAWEEGFSYLVLHALTLAGSEQAEKQLDILQGRVDDVLAGLRTWIRTEQGQQALDSVMESLNQGDNS